MRKIIGLIAVLSVLLVLTACGEKVESGEVIDKQFVAAHQTTEYNQVYLGNICSGSGTSQICTPNYTYIPYQQHHPDAWFLKLKNQEGKTGKVQVSEGLFNQAKLGYLYQNGMISAQ